MVPVVPISPPVFEPIIETVPVQVPRKSTHRSDANEARIFAASGNGTPIVRVFDHDGRSLGEFMPFPDATSVRSITADVTGDTIPDVIVATGPGGSAQLQLIDGSTFAVVAELNAFEASFIGGVFLSAADLDGDGTAEIAIAPDQGGGGRVRIFTLIGDELVIYADFFGIEDEGFRGGARVSLGDINGDGVPDLIVAAGFGGGPRIAIYDGRTLGDAVPQKLVPDFFVFEPGLRNGVFTSAGDLNGDGYDDAICGGGPGGGPRIFALSGRELIAGNEKPVANFFAGEATDRGGVWVSVKNFNDDGHDELLTAVQTEEASEVHVYSGVELPEEGDPSPWQTIDAFQAGLTHVFVG